MEQIGLLRAMVTNVRVSAASLLLAFLPFFFFLLMYHSMNELMLVVNLPE